MSEEQRKKIMQLVEIINRYERVDIPSLGEMIERLKAMYQADTTSLKAEYEAKVAELQQARLMIGKEIAAHAYTTAELQQAREANGWIAIKDKLPAGGKRVMLYNAETGAMIVGSADHGRSDGTHVFEIFHAKDCRYYSGDFTHWRPLPEPPQEQA